MNVSASILPDWTETGVPLASKTFTNFAAIVASAVCFDLISKTAENKYDGERLQTRQSISDFISEHLKPLTSAIIRPTSKHSTAVEVKHNLALAIREIDADNA